MRFEGIHVTTRDEYRGDQEPLAFVWRGRAWEVETVLDRWYEGSLDARVMPLRYFKVRTRCGETFILRFHELFRLWGLLVPPQWDEDEVRS